MWFAIRSILYYFVNSLYTVTGFVSSCQPCTSWRRGQSGDRNGRVTLPTTVLDRAVVGLLTVSVLTHFQFCGWYPALTILIFEHFHGARASRFTRGTCTCPPTDSPSPSRSHQTSMNHGPAQCPKTTPRPRQSFATVPQAPQQLPSRRRVSKCCSNPTRRRFSVACRVFG